MFKNILKISLRNLFKNRTYTIISITGLALAIGCFIVAFVFVDYFHNIDRFHENIDHIYYIEIEITRNGVSQTWGPTPVPLGPALLQDFPQVQRSVRIRDRFGTFQYQDKVFDESFSFVDAGFMDMFSFPVIRGDRNALQSPHALIITEECARKYFGTEDPIGKELTLSNTGQSQKAYTVSAVVAKPSYDSSIQFDILLPYAGIREWESRDLNDWGDWTHSFIQLQNPADAARLESALQKYVPQQNAANRSWPVDSFVLEPFGDLSDHTEQINNDIGRGTTSESKLMLLLFSAFLIALACLNYTNIGIVTASRRLSEIGIRKVLGSNKIKIVYQFMTENVVLCFIALMVGLSIAEIFLLPVFNSLFDMQLQINFSRNPALFLFLGLTLLITSLGSGLYPSVYISAFSPVHILRRDRAIKGGSGLTRILLCVQFVLTFILLTTAFIFVKNSRYQQSLDWGYNSQQLIVLPIDNGNMYPVLRDALSQYPDIIDIAGATDHFGRTHLLEVLDHEGTEYEVCRFIVGPNYPQAMQCRLTQGRMFDPDRAADQENAIVINDQLARFMHWENPIGMTVTIEKKLYTIIGQVEDFHYNVFTEPIEPTFFRLCKPEDFRYAVIRAREGRATESWKHIQETWAALFPNQPFNGFFQEDTWAHYFRELINMTKLGFFLGISALLISCMGLFGLISITIVKRMKEISVRKVHGATAVNIARLLNRNLLRQLLISALIATPAGYYLMKQLLQNIYAYHAPITARPFVYTLIILTLTALLTTAWQVYRAATANPIDMLHVE